MEEGQTVEIQETREPLREQGSIRVLLELLEQQGIMTLGQARAAAGQSQFARLKY